MAKGCRSLRPLILLLACLATWASVAAAEGYDLPTLGEPANTVLSPTKARHLGTRIVSQLYQSGRILEDPELHHYLAYIGQRLLQPTRYDADAFHFFMTGSSAINAFALPGKYIGVNAGLLIATANESELAAVMAHETVHVTQNHIARQIQAMQGMRWMPLAAALLAALAGSDGDAIQAAITGSMAAINRQRLSYTRAHEAEADRIGIRRLAAAHFDPKAMASFFDTLQSRFSLYGRQLPPLLRTHPVTNTRIAEALARAQDYPATNVIESDAYVLMKERARVLTASRYSKLLDYYQQKGAPDNTPPAKDYGYALTLKRIGRADEAVAILKRLYSNYPRQPHYAIALARAQSANSRSDAALATLKEALTRFQERPALKLEYADMLLASGQPGAARRFLLDYPGLTRHNYHAQHLLARAAGRQGKLGEAYYRQAMYYRLRGAYVPAIKKLRTALHRDDLTPIDQRRLEALLNRVIAQCKTTWPEDGCRKRVLDREGR